MLFRSKDDPARAWCTFGRVKRIVLTQVGRRHQEMFHAVAGLARDGTAHAAERQQPRLFNLPDPRRRHNRHNDDPEIHWARNALNGFVSRYGLHNFGGRIHRVDWSAESVAQ